jgi:ribosomal protein S18 acetylase RimI-like enzyme
MDFAAADKPSLITPRLPVELREVQPASVAALATAMNQPDATSVQQRFAAGRRCFAAWSDDAIVAYGWLSSGSECVGEMERIIDLPPGEVYIWDCVTLPAFRRQGLYSALLSFMATTAQAESVQRVWIGTGVANTPSLHGFANAGFRPALTVTYARLFRLKLLWYSPANNVAPELVKLAQDVFTASHEHQIGALAAGIQPRDVPDACW